MRSLTAAEVEKFASTKGVKKIAVENFLSSLDKDIGVMGNTMNAHMDAQMYKWNTATIRVIEAGIREAHKPKPMGKFGSPSKKVTDSHEKAKHELAKMAKKHNDKVIGIGDRKKADGYLWDLSAVYPSRKDAVTHGTLLRELNKIKAYGIELGEYGYELWVR